MITRIRHYATTYSLNTPPSSKVTLYPDISTIFHELMFLAKVQATLVFTSVHHHLLHGDGVDLYMFERNTHGTNTLHCIASWSGCLEGLEHQLTGLHLDNREVSEQTCLLLFLSGVSGFAHFYLW
jgi:hypothetical protein